MQYGSDPLTKTNKACFSTDPLTKMKSKSCLNESERILSRNKEHVHLNGSPDTTVQFYLAFIY